MGMPVEGPANVFCDNDAAVINSTRYDSTLKRKHNSVAYHRDHQWNQNIILWLTDKGEVDSFLGIKIKNTDDNTINSSRPALTEIFFENLGLDTGFKKNYNPALSPPF